MVAKAASVMNKKKVEPSVGQGYTEAARRRDELVLVRHCASVLAGLRPANLFSLSRDGQSKELSETLTAYRQEFKDSSLKLRVFCHCANFALVFLYRPSALTKHLMQTDHREILLRCGYERAFFTGTLAGTEQTLDFLGERLAESRKNHGTSAFPHEIGLFLGYPTADVLGFIRHSGRSALVTGYWKVYERPLEKLLMFVEIKHWEKRFCEAVSAGARPVCLVRRAEGRQQRCDGPRAAARRIWSEGVKQRA